MLRVRLRGSSLAFGCAVAAFILGLQPAIGGPKSTSRFDTFTVADPLQIVISLQEQRLYFYRGAELLSTSRVSTGKAGHRTPAGVFSILQKRRWHRSNIYSSAPMPFMQRLTWSGIALHEGYVPNRPASHGCIRLPGKFARKLFAKTKVGIPVIVAHEKPAFRPIEHPALLQPRPLRLVTMDEGEGLRKWTKKVKPLHYWMPPPVRAPRIDAEFLPISYSPQGKRRHNPRPLSPEEASLRLADLEYDLEQLNAFTKKSPKPLRILISQREKTERVRDIQRLLGKLGYDPGPADGYRGRQTRAAIRAFEKARGMEITGELSPQMVDALYATAGEEPAPAGHLYVRRGFDRLFDAPIGIDDPDKPLGTHFYSTLGFKPWAADAKWLALTANGEEEEGARAALDRIEIPQAVRNRLEKLLTPGSSMIIADGGLGPLTNDSSGFVVLIN
jgi:peptidoglycan hydrolase-like protein with peptidoglycan-binding domain